nr:MAG TPA: hypothetical protein [Ackermannviridae sp.]
MNSSNSFFVFSVFISIIIYILNFLHLKYRTSFRNFKIILIYL